MSFFSTVVALAAIGAFVWLRSLKYQAMGADPRAFLRRGKGMPGIDVTSAREKELERQVDELRKRIAVLERIATDERKGSQLAREIEALRD